MVGLCSCRNGTDGKGYASSAATGKPRTTNLNKVDCKVAEEEGAKERELDEGEEKNTLIRS